MKNNNLFSNLYYQVAALGGLLLVVIGVGSLVHLGLTTYVFRTNNYPQSTGPLVEPDLCINELKSKEYTTEEQKELLNKWAESYKISTEQNQQFDPQREVQKGQLSFSLSMLIVGLPIFLYHIRFVRKRKSK